MRILIASTIVPFIEGGGTFIVDWLCDALKRYGHEAETVKIPFYSHYAGMLEQMLAIRLMDLSESCDRLIAIRTPSYLLKHPDKVLWFIHHHRGAYDLWGTQYQDIPNTPEGLKIREAIVAADELAFGEARKIFTNSKIVSGRLREYNGVESEVMYPPLKDPESYYCKEYGDYIFYPSRITHHKRQHLVVEAMKYTKSGVRLVIAGSPDTKEQLDHLESVMKKNGLEDKVEIMGRWISDEEKIELFANCLACVYMPFLEDSYGYPSLEAHHSKKAVITCSDSGGTLELVEDGVNGFVAEPEPQALAEVMDRMYMEEGLARKMGEAGLEKLGSMDITWDNVVRGMTG